MEKKICKENDTEKVTWKLIALPLSKNKIKWNDNNEENTISIKNNSGDICSASLSSLLQIGCINS